MRGRIILPRAAWAAALAAALAAPLAAQQTPPVALDGSVRFRGEWDGRTSGAADDAATLSQVRVGLAASATPWIRAYLQLQDARAWGTEVNTLTDAAADQLDLHQGFLDLTSDAVTVRLGRQELSLADERLVGTVGWTNTGRSFDGARVMGRAGNVEWTAFWMNVAERDLLNATGLDPQQNQGSGDDGWVLGGFVSASAGAATVEVTVLADRDAATDESYTANARVHGRARALLYEAAAAYQFGPSRSAYFASAKAGIAAGQGTVAAQVDILSGDDDPADQDIRTFHTLYATNHKFYGYMDYLLAVPSRGLVDAMLRGSLVLPDRRTVRADLHHFRTTEGPTGAGTLGTELDVIGAWGVATRAGLEVGVGVFFPGELAGGVLPAFARADDAAYWGYAQLTVRWP